MYTRTLTAAAVALGLASPVLAQTELSLAHWVPPTHPLQTLGMEPWAESIKEASDGRITITIYPAQQLGAAADHYDMARDGISDISFINPGYQPGRFPIMAAAEIPFLFANAKGGVRALTEWYQDYDDEEMSDVFFCMAISHDPGTMHGKDPIQVPADIQGKTVRPANATEARFVNLLGGASVQVPAPAMREALAKGTADITQSPWESLYIFGADDLVPYHLDMPFYASINVFVINKSVMDGMSPEDRQVMEDHCTPEWAEKMSEGWADVEAAGREKIAADASHTLYTPTEEEQQMWYDAAAPLTEEWKSLMNDAGKDGDAILNGLIEALKKYNSYAG
ncbi:TRAP transporter substrate-binding protein [Pseudoruegeria sp. HB172150]|uniref:TRAP transporter substrate-binding protein n=1 Tax=Pseudoruegeria sp. HB172150 TaxID=2721164 RepID=UPI001556CF62|nr:TRAP transporter substrate-binding protein [Pseudoruegeria sp. HB172150]